MASSSSSCKMTLSSSSRIICLTLLMLMMFSTTTVLCKDMMRKSIVFDKNTPDVFYCPIHKPSGFDKLIVKARPLKKLCEFEGKPIPEDYKSDCYQDVDESDYACKEKYRIMMRMHPPGGEDPWDGKRMAKFMDVDKEFYISKMGRQPQQTKPQPNKRQPGKPQALRRRGSITARKSLLRDRLRFY